jgi:uncharacterized protein
MNFALRPTAKTISIEEIMEEKPVTPLRPIQRFGLFVLILALGLLIFVVFSHMRPLLPQPFDLVGRLVMAAGFLLAALLARRSPRFNAHWQLPFAGFIACAATGLDYYLPTRDWLLQMLHIPLKTPAGIALDKLDSSLIIIATVILLTRLSGSRLSSLYLQRGNLKKGLLTGGIAFVICVAGAIPVSTLFFGARALTVEKALAWSPWVLMFILGNAFNEELLFRGLFLQKIGPFLGRFVSNLVIAIPFTLHHTGVSYTPDALMFLLILLPLALAWGAVTQKTGSLWGAVLFHAGTDIFVVLSIFSTL